MISPQVKQLLKYKKTGTVLDLGSGNGRHALFLAKKGFKVTAVEKYLEKLKTLQLRVRELGLKVSTKKADITTYKDQRKYDVVLFTMVLHFFPPKKVAKAIRLVQGLTKLGGINVVSGYTTKNPKGTRPYQLKTGELASYYKGWEILHYEEKYGQWVLDRYADPLASKKVRRHRAVIIARKIK